MSLKVIKLETHQTIGYCIHYNYKYIGLCKVKADVGILTLLLPKANWLKKKTLKLLNPEPSNEI